MVDEIIVLGDKKDSEQVEHELTCFNCSHLDYANRYFICSKKKCIFLPTENPMINCKNNDNKRPKIRGNIESLLRIIALTNPVMIRSLPSNLVDGLQTLTDYKVIYTKKHCMNKKYNINSSFTVIENFAHINNTLFLRKVK